MLQAVWFLKAYQGITYCAYELEKHWDITSLGKILTLFHRYIEEGAWEVDGSFII